MLQKKNIGERICVNSVVTNVRKANKRTHFERALTDVID